MAISAKTLTHIRVEGISPSASVWGASGTDAQATINTSGYITNADERNMRVGDTFYYTNSTTLEVIRFTVKAVNADGTVDLSDGTVVSTGANID